MLDLKLLTTFREVALRRSFSDAATALGYTQPAVSQHVSRLETAVGVKLLERDARGVKPTPAGDLLLLRAATLLDAARRAEDDVRAAAGLGRSTVTVARSRPRPPACCPPPPASCAPAGPTCASTSACSSPSPRWTSSSPGAWTWRCSSTPSCSPSACAPRSSPCTCATTRSCSRCPPTTRWPGARASAW